MLAFGRTLLALRLDPLLVDRRLVLDTVDLLREVSDLCLVNDDPVFPVTLLVSDDFLALVSTVLSE